MAYIKRVRNTANQPFDLHDSRLGSGAEFNIVKDWAVNNTESTKYITNRTHYTDNEFELIYPDWNGYFSNQFAPETIELNNGMVLYKLTNSPITTTIADSDLEDIIVFYNPSGEMTQNTKTISEIFKEKIPLARRYDTFIELPTPTVDLMNGDVYYVIDEDKCYEVESYIENEGEPNEETKYRWKEVKIEIQSTSQIGTNIEEVIYGIDTIIFTIYNAVAQESVEIGNKTVTLETGIYAIGNPNALEEDIHPIKKPDQIIKLDIKYIPDSLIQDVDGLKTNYTTKTYVDSQIQSVINQIPDISVKMDQVNPEGSGHFKLLKTTGNIPSNIYVTGDVYSNYDPTDITAQKKLATEQYVITGLATKMDATKRIFDSLFIGTNQSNNRVLTEADIPTISGKIFKGIYANSNYLPVGIDNVSEGDYAYVLDTYNPNSANNQAKITKYTYTNGAWTAAQTSLAMNTFTPVQWRNINYNLDNILTLASRVEELEAKVNAMFEFAEGQEF